MLVIGTNRNQASSSREVRANDAEGSRKETGKRSVYEDDKINYRTMGWFNPRCRVR